MTTTWKQSALFFAAGLLAGGLTVFGVLRHGHHGFRDDPAHRRRMLDRFSRKMDLTPDQKRKVGEIFGANGQKMRGLWDEMRPKFEALRKSTDAQIRGLLNLEQQAKFEEFQKKMDARRKRWEERRGP
jgi:hypothetical protein